MIHTLASITRSELIAALADGELDPSLADLVMARPLSVHDGAAVGQTSVAVEVDNPSDLLPLAATLAALAPDPDLFAARLRWEGRMGDGYFMTCYWPGFTYIDDLPPAGGSDRLPRQLRAVR